MEMNARDGAYASDEPTEEEIDDRLEQLEKMIKNASKK
jgi:hypothetical protein